MTPPLTPEVLLPPAESSVEATDDAPDAVADCEHAIDETAYAESSLVLRRIGILKSRIIAKKNQLALLRDPSSYLHRPDGCRPRSKACQRAAMRTIPLEIAELERSLQRQQALLIDCGYPCDGGCPPFPCAQLPEARVPEQVLPDLSDEQLGELGTFMQDLLQKPENAAAKTVLENFYTATKEQDRATILSALSAFNDSRSVPDKRATDYAPIIIANVALSADDLRTINDFLMKNSDAINRKIEELEYAKKNPVPAEAKEGATMKGNVEAITTKWNKLSAAERKSEFHRKQTIGSLMMNYVDVKASGINLQDGNSIQKDTSKPIVFLQDKQARSASFWTGLMLYMSSFQDFFKNLGQQSEEEPQEMSQEERQKAIDTIDKEFANELLAEAPASSSTNRETIIKQKKEQLEKLKIEEIKYCVAEEVAKLDKSANESNAAKIAEVAQKVVVTAGNKQGEYKVSLPAKDLSYFQEKKDIQCTIVWKQGANMPGVAAYILAATAIPPAPEVEDLPPPSAKIIPNEKGSKARLLHEEGTKWPQRHLKLRYLKSLGSSITITNSMHMIVSCIGFECLLRL